MGLYGFDDMWAYAEWLTAACQRAGLGAVQDGAEVLVHGPCGHLSERIACRADLTGRSRWFWSWGRPITALRDPQRVLSPGDLDDLVTAISRVVALPR